MSAPIVIVGDANIHLDDSISPSTNIFNDIIFGCDLRQLVTRPTHEAGHTLDVVITNSCHAIKDVDPPICSDHSLISAVIPLQDATYVDPFASLTITKRNWKQLDIAAFKRDLLASDIVTQPIVDCDNFYTYDRCLRTLIDYAPLEQKNCACTFYGAMVQLSLSSG